MNESIHADKAETMRERFERWYSDNGQSPKAIERDGRGGYLLMQAQSAWATWQAADESAQVAYGVPDAMDADKAESLADLAVSTSSVPTAASTSDAAIGNGAVSTVEERPTVDLPRYHGEFRAMAQGRADYTLAAFPIYTEKYGTLLTIAASEEAVYVTQAQAAAFFDLVDRYSLNTLRASHGRLAEALKACLPFIDDAEDVAQFFADSAATDKCRAAVAAARAALASIPKELAS